LRSHISLYSQHFSCKEITSFIWDITENSELGGTSVQVPIIRSGLQFEAHIRHTPGHCELKLRGFILCSLTKI